MTVAAPSPPVDLGWHYARTRERITALLTEVGAEGAALPVPACPGWRVHDVVAHLVGIIEDAVAGRLQGIPTEEQTAAQVARHAADPLADVIATWAELSPLFEAAITERQIWPAMLDGLSHEQDIRAAVGRPGGREADAVLLAADALVRSIDAPAQVVVTLPDGRELTSGGDGTGDRYALRTDAFELLRLRLGRRSRSQVAALDWTRDPEPILDHLFVFGPTPTDQHEPA